MSDKTLLLAEAMGYIDEKFIEEAHSEARGVPYQIANRRRTFRQIAAVACLCLVAIGVARLPEMVGGGMNASGEASPMAPSSPIEPSSPGNKFPFFDKNDGNSGNTPMPPAEDAPPQAGEPPAEDISPEGVGGTETEAET